MAESPLLNGPPLSVGYFTKTSSSAGPQNEVAGARSALRLLWSRVMENPETLRPKTLVMSEVSPAGNPATNIEYKQ